MFIFVPLPMILVATTNKWVSLTISEEETALLLAKPWKILEFIHKSLVNVTERD